jgi:hypothetical protein
MKAARLAIPGQLSFKKKEKIHITSLNFCENSFFLPKLQNRAKHLP